MSSFRVSRMSPSFERRKTILTRVACAASTSCARTGPIHSMSSLSIVAARLDMFWKILFCTSGEAPLRAFASSCMSVSRKTFCMVLSSRYRKSSNENRQSSIFFWKIGVTFWKLWTAFSAKALPERIMLSLMIL